MIKKGLVFMMAMFNCEIDSYQEAAEEALKLAKGLLSEEVEMTPYSVARFNLFAGYPDVEGYAHITNNDPDPFNDEEEYEENIYYYLFETGDVIRVTYQELERLMKVLIEIEIDRGIYITNEEKEAYRALLKD